MDKFNQFIDSWVGIGTIYVVTFYSLHFFKVI